MYRADGRGEGTEMSIPNRVIRALACDVIHAALEADEDAYREAINEARDAGAVRALFEVIDDAHRRLTLELL